MKCELCSGAAKNSPESLVLQPSGYYLCPRHAESIKERQAKASKTGIWIDEMELKGQKSEGLISLRYYVYLALRIDGVSGSIKKVEPSIFCKKWAISREDFITAIASLSKKGVLVMNVKDIEAQALSHKERLENMEVAASV